MKKLSFIFAMVFAASMAMAQTAIINQTTDFSSSSVQTSDVLQIGLSTAIVTQNSDKIEKSTNEPGEFNHVAKVNQSGGNGNVVMISQEAIENINGGSHTNSASATQVGNTNESYQTQISGNWTSGGMNFTSYQEGAKNIGQQFGKKTESNFDLIQSGEQNESYQGTTGDRTGVLAGSVRQIGVKNNAVQLFHGENVRWVGAVIDQEGQNNTAKQEFDNPSTLWNDPSSADIIQRSQDNNAYQNQNGQGSYQKTEQYGANNDVYMFSTGNFNKAYSCQVGNDGIININQKQALAVATIESDGNLAKVYQAGEKSEADITQDGFRNKVVGLNGDDYAINNNDSYLNVNQTGTDNLVRSQQTSSNGAEIVVQMGVNNSSIVHQY